MANPERERRTYPHVSLARRLRSGFAETQFDRQ